MKVWAIRTHTGLIRAAICNRIYNSNVCLALFYSICLFL